VSCSGITVTPAQTEIEGQHRESFSDEFTSSPWELTRRERGPVHYVATGPNRQSLWHPADPPVSYLCAVRMNIRPLSRAERRVGPSSLRPSEASESQRVTAPGRLIAWGLAVGCGSGVSCAYAAYVSLRTDSWHTQSQSAWDQVWRLAVVGWHACSSLPLRCRETNVRTRLARPYQMRPLDFTLTSQIFYSFCSSTLLLVGVRTT